LAEPDDVEALLTGVGFGAVELTSLEEALWFGADADAAYAFVGGIGIVKGLSEGLDEVARADAHEKLKAALRSHETPEGVRFGSAVWLITARKSCVGGEPARSSKRMAVGRSPAISGCTYICGDIC